MVYHVGRNVSDDEYNRRGKFASSYDIVSDSTASDIIEFTAGDGKYPDSLVAYIDTLSGTVNIKKKSSDRYDDDEDYYFSRLMNHGFMTLGTGMTLGTTVATTDTMEDITEAITA